MALLLTSTIRVLRPHLELYGLNKQEGSERINPFLHIKRKKEQTCSNNTKEQNCSNETKRVRTGPLIKKNDRSTYLTN